MECRKYKLKGIQSIVEIYHEDSGTRDLLIPGPVVNNKSQVAQYDNLSKTTWFRRFNVGGTLQTKVPFGPERKNDFDKMLNMKMSDWLVGGQAIQGFPGLLAGWGRFSTWNKKRNDWGIWDIGPNDKFGDIIETGDDYSIIIKSLCDTPSADHIAAAKACGVMDNLNCIHGVFPKALINSPLIQTQVNPRTTICFSFYPTDRNGYSAYGNWHSLMRVKPAGENMVIGKRGTRKNIIVPILDIDAKIENVGYKTLERGIPYTLSDNNIELDRDAEGQILHLHEINTQ